MGYLYNDHKIKQLHIILQKTSAYIKGYNKQITRMYFWILFYN